MKKKILFFGIFIFLILISNILLAIDLQATDSQINKNLETANKNIETTKSFTEKEKWDYLGQEWKNILLKNKFIAFFDSFFKKINFIFIILFGQEYDFSLILFFKIILWVFFLVSFNLIFRDYSALSEEISLIISFLLPIALAHIGFLDKLSKIIFKIIFFKRGVWSWISGFVFIFILIFIITLIKKFGRGFVESRKKREKIIEEVDRKVLHKEVSWLKKIGDALRE